MTTIIARYPALTAGVVIAPIAVGAALAGGGSILGAGLSLAIILGYAIVVTVMGRRSETASAMAGRPVDERWEQLTVEASAYALGISAIVVLAAFFVADATGGAWQPFALVAAVMAVSFIGALFVLRARH